MKKNFRYVNNPPKINNINVINNETKAIEELEKGNDVMRYEFGNSMTPILVSGEYAHLIPIQNYKKSIKVGDALFCNVNGYPMTHMVCAVFKRKDGTERYLISSTQGHVFGIADKVYAYAKSTKVIQKSNF